MTPITPEDHEMEPIVSNTAADARMAHFPGELSYGEVLLRPPGGGGVVERYPAHGAVTLPTGLVASLVVAEGVALDPAPLRALVDGTVDQIEFRAGGDEALAAIEHLGSLAELGLPPLTTDHGLASVAKLHQLRSLTIAAAAVTSRGLRQVVAGCAGLTTLVITGANLDDDALAAIRDGLPALEELIIARCPITNGALADLHQTRPALTINRSIADPARVAAMRAVPDVLVDVFLPERVVHFPEHCSLGSFGFAGPLGFAGGIPAQGEQRVPALADGVLQLGVGVDADPALLKTVEPDAIQYLYATGDQFGDEVPASIAHLTGLTLLALGSAITDRGLAELGALEHLCTLEVASTTVSDAGVLSLGPLWSLRSLSLHSPLVTAAVLPHLAALPHLRALTLRDAAIGDDDLAVFGAGFAALSELDVRGTAVTLAGHVRLVRMHPGLTLNGQSLTEPGIRRLERRLQAAG